MLKSAAARKSATFFLLKATNTGLATLWSFLLTYSLVRQVGLHDYAFFATVIAFASLVLQADLGISLRLFGRMRQNFLHPESSSRQELGSAVAAALWSYSAAAILATLAFGVALWTADLGLAAYRPIYLLLFAGSVLPLPWMILRLAANAFDAYVLTEGIDFLRRLVLVLLTAALAFGLPLTLYAICFVLLWLSGLVALFLVAQRRLGFLSGAQIGQGFRVLRADLRGITASAVLSLSEFLIYIYPYYVIPLIYRDALALVVFDMFYKVTRFGVTAFLTVAETMMPHQTQAYHAHDVTKLMRWIRLSFGLSALPFAVGAGIIYVLGDRFFGTLLGHPEVVSESTRIAICVMLFLMLVQTASGAVLAAIGWLAPLARRAALSFLGMLIMAAVAAWRNWSIDGFIIGYVVVYGFEAFAYFTLMLHMVLQARRKARVVAMAS